MTLKISNTLNNGDEVAHTLVKVSAGSGQAEATSNTQTGELIFEVSAGVGVIGIEARGHWAITHAADGPFFGKAATQSDGKVLACFDASGLPVGEDRVGLSLPVGPISSRMRHFVGSGR
ncbi:MAG TPA: hypothetical protein PKM73_18975 [Verrucomicrobiota bacterium]|nr:hypothetical protein [Verrucomicrobiota bacterium]